MMKKVVSKLLALIFVSGFLMATDCDHKVKMMHKGKKVIEISVYSIQDHLDHGDTFYTGD